MDAKGWRVTPPPAGTSDPLTVEFPEALDHALATRVLAVKDPRGNVVEGTTTVDREETRWRFSSSTRGARGRTRSACPASWRT
jgi:hypothetical protein